MKKYIFIPSLALGGAEKVVSTLFKSDAINENCDLLLLDSTREYDLKDKLPQLLTTSVFLSMIFRRDYSIIQCHLVWPLIIGSIIKFCNRSFELQAVHCFSYEGYLCRKSEPLRVLLTKVLTVSMKLVDNHIFKSIDMMDDFVDIFGFKPKKFSIIHNPIDLKRNIDKAHKVDFNNFKEGTVNIAIVGRVCRAKGAFDVFKLAKIVDEEYQFHLIGDGPDFEEVSKISQSYSNVILHGRLLNPFLFMKKCQIYLSLSYNEGFPNALVEAMALGLYPIHSNCKTGPRELLHGTIDYSRCQKTQSGFLFPPGDMVACKDGLTMFKTLSENEVLSVLEKNKSVTEKFEFNRILAQYLEVLRIST